MIVTISEEEKGKTPLIFRFGEVPKIPLKPHHSYWLRIYAEEEMPIHSHLIPLEQDNLVILQFFRQPNKPPFEPAFPKGAKQLILRVQFKVDNDTPLPKLIRWSFRIEEDYSLREAEPENTVAHLIESWRAQRNLTYRTKRIPLLIQPQLYKQFFVLVISLIGAVFLPEIYDFMRFQLPNYIPQSSQGWGGGGFSLFVTIGVLVGLSMICLRVYSWVVLHFLKRE